MINWLTRNTWGRLFTFVFIIWSPIYFALASFGVPIIPILIIAFVLGLVIEPLFDKLFGRA